MPASVQDKLPILTKHLQPVLGKFHRLGLLFVYRQVAASMSTQLLTINDSPPATSSRYATLNRPGNFQPAVSGAGCPVGAVGRLRLLPKRFDGELPGQPGQFGRTLVKLFHDGEGFLEQSAGRQVLQVGRQIAGDRGERRKHATELVSRFA